MNTQKSRKVGALWAITQGLLTAVAPQISVKLLKKMLGQNFENADELEAKPGYLRQLRALGIGLAAAGVAGLAMEKVAGDSDDEDEPEGPDEVAAELDREDGTV